jgi:hypothetical protein
MYWKFYFACVILKGLASAQGTVVPAAGFWSRANTRLKLHAFLFVSARVICVAGWR